MVRIVCILHHVGSEDQTKVIRHGGKRLLPAEPSYQPLPHSFFNIVFLFCILDNTFISIYQLYIIMEFMTTFYILTMIHYGEVSLDHVYLKL